MDRKKPGEKTVAFRGRCIGPSETFRRAGHVFTRDASDVIPRASLSEAQVLELLNTHTILVEELEKMPAPVEKPKTKE